MSGGQMMVVLIVLIGCVTGILKARYNARAGIIEDRHGKQTLIQREADPEMQREVETLRERIKVLERIVTDANTLEQTRSKSIAAEIESLRD